MFGRGSGLSKAELRVLKPLNTPGKIQDFINGLILCSISSNSIQN